MTLHRLLACLAWALTLIAPARAQIRIAEEHVIHSTVLGEDRRIYVYAPAMAFGTSEPGPWPVLYLLDGDRQLPLIAAQIDFLAKVNLSMPQMIIVGIDTNHYDRMRDLTPTRADRASPDSPAGSAPTSGGGDAFLRFMQTELFPYVESHYRTAPYRMLMGHSLGGLLTVHALLTRPELFDAYVAVSPSLWWDEEALIKAAPARLGKDRLKGRQLFVSISGEGGRFGEDLRRFDALLQAQAPVAGLGFRYAEYPQESHASGPVAASYDAWKFLFPVWLSPMSDSSLAQTRAFYDALSARYHYPVLAPEGIVNGRGYAAFSKGNLKDATGFFAMNIANYPASANVWDSMGDVLVDAPKRSAACYAEALQRDASLGDTRAKLAKLGGDPRPAVQCMPR